ncbi:uncharacterized protein LOC113324454 [Papaver somniferum]|uniref:uncharacterized protein LOC113324454 n=1 Tax=Papaver somniferum TaxID=3469 RepID=UPI000E6FDF33|nr:uncharacterized protein LOC113324454 [Papaver somniferum]
MADNHSARGSRVVNITKISEKCPSISLIDDQEDNRYDSWKFSLISRLDFLRIKFADAMNILKSQWKLNGNCHLIPLGKGFFTIKLSNEEDKNYISNYRWDVQDQVLRTRNWIPDFRPENQRTSHALIWVSLPGLSLEYWDEKNIFTICDAIGNTVKVDDVILKFSSGYVARVLVELDLSEPIPNKLWIITKYGSFSQGIVLNKIPKFCSRCKIVGHTLAECRFNNNINKENPSEVPVGSVGKPIDKGQQMPHEPFDLCPPLIIPEVGTPKPNTEIPITEGRFSSLQDLAINEEDASNERIPKEMLTPTKILQMVEVNSLEASVIKFVNGKDGTVSSESVPVTSWSRLFQKPASQKAKTGDDTMMYASTSTST